MSLSFWDLLESLGSLSSWKFLFSRVDSTNSWHRFLIVSCPRCGPGLFRADGVHGDGACHRDFHEFSQTLSRWAAMYLQGVANPADSAFHLPGHRLANHMGHNCHVLRFPTNAIGWQLHFARGHDTYQWVGLDIHAGVRFCFHFKSQDFICLQVVSAPNVKVNSYTSDHRWYLGMVFCVGGPSHQMLKFSCLTIWPQLASTAFSNS